jgi:hypothetical protein
MRARGELPTIHSANPLRSDGREEAAHTSGLIIMSQCQENASHRHLDTESLSISHVRVIRYFLKITSGS